MMRSTIRELLEAGKIPEARKALQAVSREKMARGELVETSQLARRVGLPLLGLHLLRGWVRPSSRKPTQATPAEKAEYAACLIAIGANAEGESLLRETSGVPEAFLYTAYSFVSQWRYQESIPLLEKYVATRALPEYQRFVGELNLIAALVHEQGDGSVGKRLEDFLRATHAMKYSRLEANALELSAQLQIFRADWKEAERCLKHADKILTSSPTSDAFFIRKWKSVLDVLRSKGSRASLHALTLVRAESWRRGHWETARECDLFEAKATRNLKLALHLYFGTPFEAYHARLLRLLSFPLDIPETFLLHLGTGRGREHSFEPLPFQPRRLMALLFQDFYKPQRVPSLFAGLYPEEFYHPTSSPDRVHQLFRRLRSWWREHRIPLRIEEIQGTYRAHATKPLLLRVAAHRCEHCPTDQRFHALRRQFGSRVFSVSQAAKILKVSIVTAGRVLREGVTDGKMSRTGAGPATRYHFARN